MSKPACLNTRPSPAWTASRSCLPHGRGVEGGGGGSQRRIPIPSQGRKTNPACVRASVPEPVFSSLFLLEEVGIEPRLSTAPKCYYVMAGRRSPTRRRLIVVRLPREISGRGWATDPSGLGRASHCPSVRYCRRSGVRTCHQGPPDPTLTESFEPCCALQSIAGRRTTKSDPKLWRDICVGSFPGSLLCPVFLYNCVGGHKRPAGRAGGRTCSVAGLLRPGAHFSTLAPFPYPGPKPNELTVEPHSSLLVVEGVVVPTRAPAGL